MSDTHLTDKTFSEFNFPSVLLEGLKQANFEYCTPIQAQTLPIALEGKDVTGQAQTGTGKSAAFLLACFHRLLNKPASSGRKVNQPRALILAPTRELAIQIHRDAEVLGSKTDFRMVLVYGGTGYDQQREALTKGVDILIGTPGRTIDYFKQGVFDLKETEVLVLDEADRMFDLGFIKDIRYLLRRMPPPTERLSMLFSATFSQRVMELAYEHMNNPEFVKIETDKITVDRVRQTIYHTANEEKIPLLVGLLRKMDASRSLVFTNMKSTAEKVQAWLDANGFHAAVLSGDVPQQKRQRLLEEFSQGRLPVLVATDVAARGLHIPEVSHVFNFDLPQDAEDYVHRIGRTARAGADGDAISFACESHAYSLMDIEKYIDHKIEVAPIGPELLPELERPKRIERYRPRSTKRSSSNNQKRSHGSHKTSSRRNTGRPSQGKPQKSTKEKPAQTKPKKRSDSGPALG